MMKNILLTGSAGFIGFHLCKKLLSNGFNVIGIDNLNEYYDLELKKSRLKNISDFASENDLNKNYKFEICDISNKKDLNKIFKVNDINIVINLAAQAGVRYSIENPMSYVSSNLTGFVNILEECKLSNIEHLIFASSSSVYGMNKEQPFSVDQITDYPISLYAATKKSNELLAFSYSHLYQIPITGLRFFTVYGPYGRPDMAYFKFTKSIIEGIPIDVYNNGDMKRDFTYIDDLIEGIISITTCKPISKKNKVSNSNAAFRVYNIGNNNPVTLTRFIKAIEKSIGKEAIKNYLPMQPGDVPITYADISELSSEFSFKPKTSIEEGIEKFVDWYSSYYGQKIR
jgi:UDP-glucuronate 4-epimerase